MRLKDARKKAGLSQKELAEKMFVQQSTISAWETGSHQINDASLKKLAAVLGCTTDFLLGIDEKNPAGISGEVFELAIRLEQLPPEDRESVRRYVDFLKAQRNP